MTRDEAIKEIEPLIKLMSKDFKNTDIVIHTGISKNFLYKYICKLGFRTVPVNVEVTKYAKEIQKIKELYPIASKSLAGRSPKIGKTRPFIGIKKEHKKRVDKERPFKRVYLKGEKANEVFIRMHYDNPFVIVGRMM